MNIMFASIMSPLLFVQIAGSFHPEESYFKTTKLSNCVSRSLSDILHTMQRKISQPAVAVSGLFLARAAFIIFLACIDDQLVQIVENPPLPYSTFFVIIVIGLALVGIRVRAKPPPASIRIPTPRLLFPHPRRAPSPPAPPPAAALTRPRAHWQSLSAQSRARRELLRGEAEETERATRNAQRVVAALVPDFYAPALAAAPPRDWCLQPAVAFPDCTMVQVTHPPVPASPAARARPQACKALAGALGKGGGAVGAGGDCW